MILALRTLAMDDVPAVLVVQSLCYRAELIETADSYLRKLALFPQGCLGAFDGSRLAGYFFGHPWARGTKVPLDCSDYALPEKPDCMYFHDLAVAPEFRATGAARLLVDGMVQVARTCGLMCYALVAVQQSEGYWARWGFAAQHTLEYGNGLTASYMTCGGDPAWR